MTDLEKKKGPYGKSVIETNIGESRTYLEPPGAGITREKDSYVKHKKL